jgi:ubiquinone/menaquinone biosynthesis C-methylase UbiE
MSSYVYMKVLEAAPERYDEGIRRLSRGRIETLYEAIASRASGPGRRVLDLGCGTGGLTMACAARGADVTGIDRDAGMLEVAARKGAARTHGGRIDWAELGAMEIEDCFDAGSFDAVVSCLLFSELLPEEQAYVLAAAHSRLHPGGTIVIGDEARPATRAARLWRFLRRLPAVLWTYLLTQTTTRPVVDLAAKLRSAGFERVTEEVQAGGDFVIAQGWRAT